MKGVYFALSELSQQCWIESTDKCEQDADKISNIMYGQKIHVRYIQTETIEIAHEIMQYIDGICESRYITGNWYEMSPIDMGIIYQKAVDYLNWNHFYIDRGELMVFPKYR